MLKNIYFACSAAIICSLLPINGAIASENGRPVTPLNRDVLNIIRDYLTMPPSPVLQIALHGHHHDYPTCIFRDLKFYNQLCYHPDDKNYIKFPMLDISFIREEHDTSYGISLPKAPDYKTPSLDAPTNPPTEKLQCLWITSSGTRWWSPFTEQGLKKKEMHRNARIKKWEDIDSDIIPSLDAHEREHRNVLGNGKHLAVLNKELLTIYSLPLERPSDEIVKIATEYLSHEDRVANNRLHENRRRNNRYLKNALLMTCAGGIAAKAYVSLSANQALKVAQK